MRETIKRQGGPLPEDLPTLEKNIQQIQKEEQKHITQKIQPPLFNLDQAED